MMQKTKDEHNSSAYLSVFTVRYRKTIPNTQLYLQFSKYVLLDSNNTAM